MSFNEVNPKQIFPEMEKKIIENWKNKNIFKKSISNRDKKNEYVFYDGPPFATGLPHYGHILAGTIKDVVPRFWTMRGKRIERRFGWDCHGLPVENIVEDELKITSKKDIENIIGVAQFNEKCRASVLKYTKEWEKTVERMGRWVDFSDDYKTMDSDYMESIWWVFKQLWDKELIYKGMKPMHVCPRCVTPLSNFEVTQGYKDITDISVVAKFQLLNEKNTFILAWTTTPWTLPGNVLLAIGREIEYVKVTSGAEKYILAKDKVDFFFPDKSEDFQMEFIDSEKLINKKYIPLFDSLSDVKNGFRVVYADFITTEEGTGIVHCAGPYGEDDMNLCIKENISLKHHVNMDGTFSEIVKEWAGKDCKKMDQNIVNEIDNRGFLFSSERYKHSYPHCWRCDTPLLNYATDSWFVSVTKIKDNLLKNNSKIHWVPEHIKDGRFGKWLEAAKDWAISRARFWGTPIPVWKAEDSESYICIGSIAELEKRTNSNVSDLHKHKIDHLIIEHEGKRYKRVDEVLDCWFESGSMPYAQIHYPFSVVPKLKNRFILMRHGESLNNIKKIVSTDINKSIKYPLTEKGRKEIDQSLKELSKEKIDFIYSSGFQSSVETSNILAHNLDIGINIDERLREVKMGDFEEQSYEDVNQTWSRLDRLHNPPNENGESLVIVRSRMLDFISEINSKYDDKIILIVSHLEPIKMLISAFNGLNKAEILSMNEIDNGEFVELNNNKDLNDFNSLFPAEFIAEGQDQTRGWFYTLTVLSTALFDQPAFKNVIVNGIVLAQDGKKMSKRLKNYPDPNLMFETYGADSLRYYLLNSPVVKADDLRFSEEGVKNVVKNTILPLWNSYSFFVTYANIDKWEKNYHSLSDINLANSLDRWIISRLTLFLNDVTESLENYDLQKSTDISLFIDDLTNWYIRRSRRRFWKTENDDDKNSAYQTLHFVLSTVSKIIAPFMPFIAEEIYTNIENKESVHLENWPKIDSTYIDQELNEKFSLTRRIVKLGHSIRAKFNLKVRQPLNKIEIAVDNKNMINIFEDIILEELNIKKIVFIDDISKIGEKKVVLDAKILGPKFGKEVQEMIQLAKNKQYEIIDSNQIQISNHKIDKGEFEFRFDAFDGKCAECENELLVAIDNIITDSLRSEGLAREIIRHIQELRKKAMYNVNDRIITSIDKNGLILINEHKNYIMKETLTDEISEFENPDESIILELDSESILIKIKKA